MQNMGSWPQNTEFQSIFVINWRFLVKPKANTYEILAKIRIFLKPIKIHIRDHYVLPIQNMGVMTMKYRVSASFCRKLVIFGKTEG
jgi:hypothetical protein